MPKTVSRIGPVAFVAALALSAGAAQAQVAARDAAGAPLRGATAAETAALSAAKTEARPVGMITGAVNPRPVKYPNGAVGQELDSSTMMYSVARRNPDGSISRFCVTGTESAERLVHSTAPTTFVAKGKEQAYAVK